MSAFTAVLARPKEDSSAASWFNLSWFGRSLEDIFERIGCEVSRATMSVWCDDMADLIVPLYGLMAARVRQAHVVGATPPA